MLGPHGSKRPNMYAQSSKIVHIVNKLFKETPTRNRARQNLEIGMPTGSVPHGGVIRLPSLHIFFKLIDSLFKSRESKSHFSGGILLKFSKLKGT